MAVPSVVTARWPPIGTTLIIGLTWDGNQTSTTGPSSRSTPRTAPSHSGFKAAIDGFDLRGGDQQGFPTNINPIGGGTTGLPGTIVTQGGAVFANAYARNLQITNNTVQNNGGGYGTIRIGTPNLTEANANSGVRIANNRIIANGGTNLAGAIGLFAGSDGYEVAGNDICGNFSAEYGAGISHFGLSPGGKIHDNKIYFNQSYDEGAGIMIAGELPADPTALYGQTGGPKGSGAVDVYNNLIQANLANDDGGGLRLSDGRQLPDQRLQQHDRQQRVDARRWRCRSRRRSQRAVLQQHGDEESDDGDSDHQRRPGRSGRFVDGSEQRLNCRRRCRLVHRCSATRCCSTTSSGTTEPERWCRTATR